MSHQRSPRSVALELLDVARWGRRHAKHAYSTIKSKQTKTKQCVMPLWATDPIRLQWGRDQSGNSHGGTLLSTENFCTGRPGKYGPNHLFMRISNLFNSFQSFNFISTTFHVHDPAFSDGISTVTSAKAAHHALLMELNKFWWVLMSS